MYFKVGKYAYHMVDTNERRHYKVTLSLIGWAQTYNQPSYHTKDVDFLTDLTKRGFE